MSLRDKLLSEETSSGGYPNDGFGGPASDDDGAPGTTVFGDKMVPVEVPNRLTGKTIKYVPAADLDQDWNYDEFANSKGMGSHKGYSKTLDGLKGILGNRLWKHVTRKPMKISGNKKEKRDANDIDQTAKLSNDDEETIKVEEQVDITNKIDVFLKDDDSIETIIEQSEVLLEASAGIVSAADRRTLSKTILGGKSGKVKLTSIGLTVNVRMDGDDQVEVTYPKNDEVTFALVEIADSMGMTFSQGKNGKNLVFTFNLD